MNKKYYDSYRRFINGFSYEDQENYTQDEDKLDELETKEIVSDEEYNNTISRLENTNNMAELGRYRRNYVSESEYYFTREDLLRDMNEIETRYRVTEEQLAEDRRMRASYSRDRLKLLSNFNVIRDVNVDNLSDEEVVVKYRDIKHGLSDEREKEIVNLAITRRARENIEKMKKAREERDSLSPSNNAEMIMDNTEENKVPIRDDIEKEIERFNNTADRIKKQFQEIDRKLVFEDSYDLTMSEALEGLGEELEDLREMGNVIIQDMDEFRLHTQSNDFSMTPAEINKTIKDFTNRFKELKVLQVQKYNARVDLTNTKIRELKGLTGLEPEVMELVNNLEELDKCSVKVSDWRNVKYLKEINYNKLLEVNSLVHDINSRLNREVPVPREEGLEGDINQIENELSSIESEIVDNMDMDTINRLNQSLDQVNDMIRDFNASLELNKDSISEEDYNNYKERVNSAEVKLNELRNKINKNELVVSDYQELEKKTSSLEKDTDKLYDDVETFFGHIDLDGVNYFKGLSNTLENRMNDLKQKIVKRHEDGKIDINQYNNLLDRMNGVENRLNDSNDRLRDPGMVRDADIFALLNGEIGGLEKILVALEEQVNKFDKSIKREERKKIDLIFKRLENEVKKLEELTEKYKDENPEKYNSTMNRLNNVKDRLNKVGKNYRKKCPLLVRAVKSAKDFYKKHKKMILIIAGLAAFALVAHQVLIPAIMHGNIMIAGTTPVLRPFAKFSNKILGGIIGATKDANGIWSLASGVIINPSCATSSLLKGLAISGVGTTALVAPLVVAIKKLVDKMKTVELKKKLSEEKDKLKNKVVSGKENAKKKLVDGKEKLMEKVNSSKKKVSNVNYDKLYKEFVKSEQSLEEFVKDNELSEKDMEVLELKARLDELTKGNSKKKRR